MYLAVFSKGNCHYQAAALTFFRHLLLKASSARAIGLLLLLAEKNNFSLRHTAVWPMKLANSFGRKCYRGALFR